MAPVPPDIVRCSVRWEWQNEIAVNTIHVLVENPGGPWGSITQRVADLLLASYQTGWSTISQYFHNDARIVRIDAYHLEAASGKTIDKRTAVPPLNGLKGMGADSSPLELAVVVSLYGYDPAQYDPQGARKRGRIYLPFLSKAVIGAGGRNVQWQAFRDFHRALLERVDGTNISGDPIPEINSGVLRPVILSRTYAEANPIRAVICDDLFDVQRRRQNALVSGRPAVLLAS